MQDLVRINQLISGAASKCGSDTALATELGTSKQVVSDWRKGRKFPSVAAQVDIATIAGSDVAKVALMALIEDAEEPKRSRLQAALRALHARTITELRNS